MSYEPSYGPLTTESAYELFNDWHQRNSYNIDLTAATLGVSRRTAQRWIEKRTIPTPIGVLLHQLKHGQAMSTAAFRGKWAINYHWKKQLERYINERRWDGFDFKGYPTTTTPAKPCRHRKSRYHAGKQHPAVSKPHGSTTHGTYSGYLSQPSSSPTSSSTPQPP